VIYRRIKRAAKKRSLHTRLVIVPMVHALMWQKAECGRREDSTCDLTLSRRFIEAPAASAAYDPIAVTWIYDGVIRPEFYGWVFRMAKNRQCRYGRPLASTGKI